MKKFNRICNIVVTLLMVVAFCIIIGIGFIAKSYHSKHYAQTAVVVKVNRNDDIVVCEDYNGNAWEFYGTEDWVVGDCVSLVMNDSGTQEIYDDEIISARYSGWIIHR